jgi:hypothetical protein
MTFAIIVMFFLIGVILLILGCVVVYLAKRHDMLMNMDKEQHSQNKDIIALLKYRNESSAILLQHAEILKYLIEQDVTLNKIKYSMGDVVGEA